MHRLVFGFLLLVTACASPPRDTEGHEFGVRCEDDRCALELATDAGSVDYRIAHEGRLLLACPRKDDRGLDCRPLVCETARTCTAIADSKFGCENGLCQAPDRALTPADRTALCLAGTGSFRSDPIQVERLTLAHAARASVPVACRAP